MVLSFGEYAESAKGLNSQNAALLVKKKHVEVVEVVNIWKRYILFELVLSYSKTVYDGPRKFELR